MGSEMCIRDSIEISRYRREQTRFLTVSCARRCVYDFFFQAEDGIRDRSPSRGLGDVYKRQPDCGVDASDIW